MNDRDWLIYDGGCQFCRHMVAWVKDRDRDGRFRCEPYQTCPSPPMTPELRQLAQRAVQVLTADGHRLEAGRAVLFVLAKLDWHPRLVAIAGRRPLIWFVELGYHLVSRARNRLSRVLFRTPDNHK